MLNNGEPVNATSGGWEQEGGEGIQWVLDLVGLQDLAALLTRIDAVLSHLRYT